MQIVAKTACIGNETGNRRAERDTNLLNGRDRRGGDVLLADFRAAHDALRDERPGGADTRADQRDREEQSRNRPGYHLVTFC